MIDLEIIGRRIKEQRKYFLKISQEQMAEDLNMYQADISNMEKAKSGSGIGDLQKLDLIADYLNIPLETLIFGREDRNMLKYHGSKMQLKRAKKKILKQHSEILKRLTGFKTEEEIPAEIWECGPYLLYGVTEFQHQIHQNELKAVLPKVHLYVFIGSECIGCMVFAVTDVMGHVLKPSLDTLQAMIPSTVIDVLDVWRTLNPYWALWNFSEDGAVKDTYYEKMYERMDALRESGENRHIIYIESAYVREDCRRNGIFRMMTDYVRATHKNAIMWLNMEPTSGFELNGEFGGLPSYSIADLGQLNLNASIAEHVGFHADSKTCSRETETLDDEGNVQIEKIQVRKCACYLPKEIRTLLSKDGDLVEQGRALEKLHGRIEGKDAMDVFTGRDGDDIVCEVKISEADGNFYYAIAISKPDGRRRYLISRSSILQHQKERIIEEYQNLKAARISEKYDALYTAYVFLGMHIIPSSAESAGTLTESAEAMLFDTDPQAFREEENFTIPSIQGFGCNNGEFSGIGLEATMIRTNTANKGETLYAVLFEWEDGDMNYLISRSSFLNGGNIDPIEEVESEEELEECFYRNIFITLRERLHSEEYKALAKR